MKTMLRWSIYQKISKKPLDVAILVEHDSFGDFSWEDSDTLPQNSYIPAQDLLNVKLLNKREP